jgi:hypothetical protein
MRPRVYLWLARTDQIHVMSRKSCPINSLPGYRNQPIPRLLGVGIHYVQKEGWGRWHGLRLTDVPAAANLLRLSASHPISSKLERKPQ